MAKYAKTIYDFVSASVKLAKSLNRNVQNVIKAGKALAELAKALGSEAKTSVNKIQTTEREAMKLGNWRTVHFPRDQRLIF